MEVNKMLWELAKRQLLHIAPVIAPYGKKNKFDNSNEYIEIFEFIKNNEILQIKDLSHKEEMIKDESIDKLYIKNKVLDNYLYLVFIKIGIEALKKEMDFDHAEIGEKILDEIIDELR